MPDVVRAILRDMERAAGSTVASHGKQGPVMGPRSVGLLLLKQRWIDRGDPPEPPGKEIAYSETCLNSPSRTW